MSDENEAQLWAALRSAVATMEHLGKIALEASMAFNDFILACEEDEGDQYYEEEETDSE